VFVLVPLGSDQSVRRLPWFTIAVIVLCTLVQIHETSVEPSASEVQATVERAQVVCRQTPDACPDLAKQLDKLDRGTFVHQYAFRPAHPSLVDALASAFIHGGWLHLIGNMLFLWLIGCNLEDRWGHLPFAVLYLAGALAAVFAFSLVHPHSEQGLVGASGAIAAGMGAFAVTHHGANIRVGYLSFVMRLRAGAFWVPAWVAFPVWFALQLAFALEEGDFTTVGYSAHVGGFVFGLAAAALLRATGIERRYLIPAANKGLEWEEDPEYLEASDLLRAGRYTDARRLLRNVLARTPDHAAARDADLKIAAALGERAVVEPVLVAELDRLSRARRFLDVHELYALVEQRIGDVPLTDRALAQVIHAATDQRDVDVAERAMRRLVIEHRDSDLIPKALWETAQAQLAAKRTAEGRRTLEDLVARYPMDPIADEAKRQLA
jgi:membrane associated rhomboid family serine protease